MRLKKKIREVNHLCPNCMSIMTLKDSDYECTGNNFDYWREEFKSFDKLSESGKKMYLKTLSDEKMFLELYKNKNNLNCGFSTKLVDMTPYSKTRIPDPMIVGKIELNFGRSLTDLEKEEDFVFYRKGKNFSLQPLSGYTVYKIPYIVFPDDC